jgi:cytochrome c biogenesis protein CcmG/thiol:disulfide interchange protein DsbE
MPRTPALLLTLLLTTACDAKPTTTPAAGAVSVGAPAPALAAPRLDGAKFDLAAERGKLVLVDFWASWCEPCRRELPVLEDLHQRHAAAGLVVVGVSLDEQQGDAEAFLREKVKLSFPVVFDADRAIGKTWSPPKMPTVFLVERDGTVARIFDGEKPGQLDEIAAEVAKRLGGKSG